MAHRRSRRSSNRGIPGSQPIRYVRSCALCAMAHRRPRTKQQPPDERIVVPDKDAGSVACESTRATEDAVRREEPPSGDVAKLLGLCQALQLLQRLVLDLADALARDVERATDLVEGAGVLAAEAVAELEPAAFAIGGGLGALVGDELAELGLLLVADGLLERHGGLGGALDRVDLLGVDAGDLGDLVGGGLAAQ